MTDFEAESARVAEMRRRIGGRLAENTNILENKKREIVQYREYLWDHHAHDGFPPEQLQEAQRQENAYQNIAAEQEKLEALMTAPYFARIDFEEDGEDRPEPFYIGRFGFIDDDMEMPVYDWRSPVASMFYDYEYGRAAYLCPAGKIEGELVLKRQLIIERGLLVSMFDSALEIQDEILQQMLSQNTGDKMKTIITTIQREQNRAIRDESTDVLVVSGNAGSGKTSVALHRISYLLYRHRDTLHENDILIFSPSETFNGYISDVLPQLGEKGVRQTTFQEFAGGLLDLDTQPFFDFVEAELNGELPPGRTALAQQKGSKAFADFIEAKVGLLSEQGPRFSDILYLDRPVFTAAEMSETFRALTPRLSVEDRLVKVRAAFYEKLEKLKPARIEELKTGLVAEKGRNYFLSEREILAEARARWFRDFKALEADYTAKNMLHAQAFYRELLREYFSAVAAGDFAAGGAGKKLAYEDVAPLLLLGCLTGQLKSADEIRHAVVDEAQDYTYMQFRALSAALKYTKFTVLGDVRQTVDRLNRPDDFSGLQSAFGGRSVRNMHLEKTYRSTAEISGFASKLLGVESGDAVDRHGETPQVVDTGSQAERAEKICAAVAETGDSFETTAIITRTRREAELLYGQFKDRLRLSLVTEGRGGYAKGVMLLPCYLAKGLEFDNVIVDDTFDPQADKNLLYVCCTRALHRLTVIR